MPRVTLLPTTLFCVLTLLPLSACPKAGTAYPSGDTKGVGDAAASSAAEDYKALEDSFFEGFFAMSPVTATVLGVHEGDAQWPDLSRSGREAMAAWVLRIREGADKIDALSLDANERVDLRILQDQLALMQLDTQDERSWETSPLNWVYLIGAGMDSLLYRDYAPLDTRVAALVSRLEGLPVVVASAKDAMADAAAIKAPHAKVAAGQIEGLLTFIDSEIPKQSAGIDAELGAKLNAARKTARSALVDFRDSLLSEERLAAAKGEWRLGAELFAEKLPHTLGMDLSADEVYARAQKAHKEVRARMEVLAFELYEPLFGKKPPSSADELGRSAIVKQVLDALSDVHPSAEQLRDACENNLASIQGFVTDEQLVPLDPKEILEVIWTPPHQRGVAIAGLDPAPPFDKSEGLQSFYIVQPLPPSWDEKVRDSFLREYNHFMLEILSIHEAIPGHFVQLYYGKRERSRVRKAFMNGPFVEGWAVYTEKLMVDAGYTGVAPAGDKPKGVSDAVWKVALDPQMRAKAIALHGSKFFLRAVTNTILDHDIHAGTMNQAEAITLMTHSAYQQEGEARGKWIRAQVTSTQLSTYFAGASAWFELRAQADEAGATQDLAAWHAEALNHGAPPVGALPDLMAP